MAAYSASGEGRKAHEWSMRDFGSKIYQTFLSPNFLYRGQKAGRPLEADDRGPLCAVNRNDFHALTASLRKPHNSRGIIKKRAFDDSFQPMLSKVWPTLRRLICDTGPLPQAPPKGKGSTCTSVMADVDSNNPPSAPSSPKDFQLKPPSFVDVSETEDVRVSESSSSESNDSLLYD
eukprot:1975825-Pleurochrysis_carterae.AAC.1